MYLTGMTQRDQLFEIADRWVRGRPEPLDGRFLTLAFLVDPFVTAPPVKDFLRDVVAPDGRALKIEHVRTKEGVRRRIADSWPHLTIHATDLLTEFRRHPERYYPTTPVDLFTVTSGERDLRAMVRFKSITRIADKVSRRATRRLEHEIRRRADSLAAGPSGSHPAADPQLLLEAEHDVCRALAEGELSLSRSDLVIHDLLGAKLIGDAATLERLEERALTHPGVVSVQRTEHRGDYRDTHLVVELRCPVPSVTMGRLLAKDWSHSAARGLAPDDVLRAIPAYVEGAASSFFVEVILTTPEDLVESEFGRGIHEERTERQRDHLRWARQLSTNVTLIALSMLLVAAGPKTMPPQPPLMLQGRYLPDTIAVLLARLFDLDVDRSPLSVPPAEVSTLVLPGSGSPGRHGAAALFEA